MKIKSEGEEEDEDEDLSKYKLDEVASFLNIFPLCLVQAMAYECLWQPLAYGEDVFYSVIICFHKNYDLFYQALFWLEIYSSDWDRTCFS